MEQYVRLSAMLVLWIVCCHGQHVTNFTAGQLHSRVLELEKTVDQLLLKLVEMKKSESAPVETSTQSAQKRGFLSPVWSVYPNPLSTSVGLTSDDGEVGIYVLLSDDVPLEYGRKIPFNIIESNIGMGYNPATAEFVCPVSGTYLFSLSIVCRMGSYLESAVEIRNGHDQPRYLLNTVCDHRKRYIPGGGSLHCGETHNGGTAIVSLTKGETVTVKKMWPDYDVSIVAGDGLSSFTGYLLNAKG